jgi:hypothetical protein
MQEQLRPLFCAVEVNIESDKDPADALKPTVQIPAGFFADPRLSGASVAIPRANYDQALQQHHSQMPEPPDGPGGTDADHAWLAPVKANSDITLADALVEMGVIDNEFVADVLAVDFTNPLISAPRCGLLTLVPAEGGSDFLSRFETALKASTQPAAKQLLDNLTDPKRDANFHRQQVAAYLDACQTRASKPEAANEWFGVLVQRRAEVDRAELSKHPNDQKILEVGRVVFPSASAPGGSVGLTPACEVRPQYEGSRGLNRLSVTKSRTALDRCGAGSSIATEPRPLRYRHIGVTRGAPAIGAEPPRWPSGKASSLQASRFGRDRLEFVRRLGLNRSGVLIRS